MNKIGIYYAYWTQQWDADFVPFVTRVKRLGFDVLEVNAGTVVRLSSRERDRLRLAAERAGLELTYCIGLPARLDPAAESAATRQAGVRFLIRCAQTLRTMGHQQLGGIIYGAWPGRLPPGADKRHRLERSVQSMREVMPAAEDCGVYFNVEVVNRFEQFLLNTAAEAVDYVARVGSRHCRVLLDSFHLNIEEDDIRGAIRATGERLGHFHIGETNRRAPGVGRMPWREIFEALAAIDYRGAITMEPFVVPGGAVGRAIGVYRDLSGGRDRDAEAARALTFVREGLLAAQTSRRQHS